MRITGVLPACKPHTEDVSLPGLAGMTFIYRTMGMPAWVAYVREPLKSVASHKKIRLLQWRRDDITDDVYEVMF